MIRVENIKTYNIINAIYSARNPMNSWDKSDSDVDREILGEKDLNLAKKLFKAGTEHRKYLRQIFVSMDITAPLYWWKQADQYKIGTVSNSCSTMHKLMAKEFTEDDFSFDHIDTTTDVASYKIGIITTLNKLRNRYLLTKDKNIWYTIVQFLPESYNQKRTITMNYENVFTIIKQRSGHKLDEWNEFVNVLTSLPYVKKIGGLNGETETVCD